MHSGSTAGLIRRCRSNLRCDTFSLEDRGEKRAGGVRAAGDVRFELLTESNASPAGGS